MRSMFMRSFAAAMLAAMLSSSAEAIVFKEFTTGTEDLYISDRTTSNDFEFNFNGDNLQAAVNSTSPGSVRRSLLHYDLSHFSGQGQFVIGKGTLNLYVENGCPSCFKEATMVAVLLTPNDNEEWWGADYDFMVPNWTNYMDNFGGGEIGRQFMPGNLPRFTLVQIEIDGSAIQDWIDNPADNWGMGLMLDDETIPSSDLEGKTFYSSSPPTGLDAFVPFLEIDEAFWDHLVNWDFAAENLANA